MRKNTHLSFALFLSTLILMVLLSELGARFLYRKNALAIALSQSDLYYTYDGCGIRRHVPGKTGYELMWDGSGKAEMRINSLGFRGPEVALKKPAGSVRIFFLGDSITLGGRLPEEKCFVGLIGQALGEKSSPSHEVINGGMGDIGLREEMEILKTKGLALAPDVVLLGWYLNDGRPPMGFPEEKIYNSPVIRWLNQSTFLHRSYLFGYIYHAVRQMLLRKEINLYATKDKRFDWANAYNEKRWQSDPAAFKSLIHLARFDWGDAWNLESRIQMFEKIKNMNQQVKQAGAKFGVFSLPLQAQIAADFDAPFLYEPQGALARFCEQEGIPLLDLLPVLKKHRPEHIFYDQCHYTPGGNKIVAEAIIGFLDGFISPKHLPEN